MGIQSIVLGYLQARTPHASPLLAARKGRPDSNSSRHGEEEGGGTAASAFALRRGPTVAQIAIGIDRRGAAPCSPSSLSRAQEFFGQYVEGLSDENLKV